MSVRVQMARMEIQTGMDSDRVIKRSAHLTVVLDELAEVSHKEIQPLYSERKRCSNTRTPFSCLFYFHCPEHSECQQGKKKRSFRKFTHSQFDICNTLPFREKIQGKSRSPGFSLLKSCTKTSRSI